MQNSKVTKMKENTGISSRSIKEMYYSQDRVHVRFEFQVRHSS